MNEQTQMPNGQRIPNGMLQDNYPRNMWWVAARSDEVTTNPMLRWLLETPVVLYRLEDGTPAALYNRCPHRWAPLSEGHVTGNKIICPYHGMEFNTNGHCTKAPTQTMMPKTAQIPAFTVREAGAFIWVWMGDADAIDRDPPDVSYQTDPDWTFLTGYYEVAANWVLIRENVLDLTHIAFLHKNTFKQDDWITAPDTYMDGETVCYEQEFDLAPLSPLFCAGMGLPEDKPIKRTQVGRMPTGPRARTANATLFRAITKRAKPRRRTVLCTRPVLCTRTPAHPHTPQWRPEEARESFAHSARIASSLKAKARAPPQKWWVYDNMKVRRE